LSYLDILVLSAITPSVFVAKVEVKHWPVFGWFARLAGTLFADRQQRVQVGPLAKALEAVLDQRTLAVLFPEGTSSDGRNVLPFKSALLGPVATSPRPVSASAIHYALYDGGVGDEVCYWKDMTLLPHLINLLSKQGVAASVVFSQIDPGGSDRKVLARRLHAEVLSLKNNFRRCLSSPN
jgi:1-acyl-sn-glycerol-3-phosphate acyltransferase